MTPDVTLRIKKSLGPSEHPLPIAPLQKPGHLSISHLLHLLHLLHLMGTMQA